MSSTAIVACEVYTRELEALREKGLLPEDWTLKSLEMGLHDHPPMLQKTLQEEIYHLEESEGPEYILLAYGHCGGGLDGLRADKATLIAPKAHDCISVLLGSVERHRNLLKSHPNSYFSSAGWFEGGKLPGPEREAQLLDRYKDMDEDVLEDLLDADRSTFSSYNRLTHVRTEITQEEEIQKAKGCAKGMGWELKVEKGSYSWVLKMIQGDFSEDHFLVVKAGQTLAFPQKFFKE